MNSGIALSVSPRSGLDGRLIGRHAIDHGTKEAMMTLLDAHFAGVDRPTFEQDLTGKNWVIVLEDEGGSVRGFSTLAVYRSEAPGRPVTVVYSGDTIVERQWWGSPTLARTWIRSVQSVTPLEGTEEVYWLLLTSGFRTYRFLPVFFRDFHPRHDEAMPDGMRHLLERIARERFGRLYDPASGLVRFPRPHVLAPDLLNVPAGKLGDPHIAYFLRHNPGYVDGDEMVCVTRVHADNLTAAGRRMARPA